MVLQELRRKPGKMDQTVMCFIFIFGQIDAMMEPTLHLIIYIVSEYFQFGVKLTVPCSGLALPMGLSVVWHLGTSSEG